MLRNATSKRIGAAAPNVISPRISHQARCLYNSAPRLSRSSLHFSDVSRRSLQFSKLHPISHTHLQSRPYTLYQRFRASYDEAKQDIWRKHPILVPSMVIFILTVVGTGFYFVYDYVANVKPRFDRYPKPVSHALRKAVYYTEVDLQPMQALEWYKHSLVLASKMGLHPFSDEVLGIRFQVAAMLEKAGMIKAAIDILEKARVDCEEWVADGRKKQMILERERELQRKERRRGAETDPESVEREQEALEAEAKEETMRDEVMKKVQGIWLKLAELYGCKHINDAEKAENALIQAITVSRNELQRRKDHNLPISKEDGKSFITLTHVATAYNELADFYVKQGKSNLATTLYMQALALIKEDQDPGEATCAQVVLLNNISSQMAQQAQLANIPQPDTVGPPLSHDQLLHAASEWAKKALEVAAHIKPPVRDAECDQGCLAATYNLGEIAEMQQSYIEAEKLYRTARKLAVDLKSDEGVKRADEALKRLKENR